MSKIIDSQVCWDGQMSLQSMEGFARSKGIQWTVDSVLNRSQARILGMTASAAVVNGQRLTAKQLAKFNKARLDKINKR